MKVTLILKQYSSNSKAQAYCNKIIDKVDFHCPGALLAVNQLDNGCHQVKLSVDFQEGQVLYLPALMS